MSDSSEFFRDSGATIIFRSQGLPPDPVEPEGVIGRYELLLKLGEGGFSHVYKARDTSDGAIVAIKILRSTISRNSDNLERLKREFKATTALRHRNIIQAFDIGEEGFSNSWIHFLVMEFVDGWDLAAAIKVFKKLPPDKSRSIIRDIGAAVSYAHNLGFIHRDIKPHNILLPREGVPKLSDFGLVKHVAAESTLTGTGQALGTLAYMPPEQFRDAKSVTRSCDIYALAMTYLVMETGKYPFESQHQSDRQAEKIAGLAISQEEYPELSDDQRQVIRRALSPKSDERYSSVDAFIRDLFA